MCVCCFLVWHLPYLSKLACINNSYDTFATSTDTPPHCTRSIASTHKIVAQTKTSEVVPHPPAWLYASATTSTLRHPGKTVFDMFWTSSRDLTPPYTEMARVRFPIFEPLIRRLPNDRTVFNPLHRRTGQNVSGVLDSIRVVPRGLGASRLRRAQGN